MTTVYLVAALAISIAALVFISIKYGENKAEKKHEKTDADALAEDLEIATGPDVDDPVDELCKPAK